MRSQKLELLDLGPDHYTVKEYRHCLKMLGRIGRLTGGNRAGLKGFASFEPLSILDVGCGGGDFAALLAQQYPEAHILGIDLDEEAIRYAQDHHCHSNLTFEVQKEKSLPYPPKTFDVVTASLVCHHMSDDEIVEFLKASHAIAKQGVVLNDLHRHPLATLAFALTAPTLCHNRLITHDGLLSIRRAFKRKEWNTYLSKAGLEGEVEWHRLFRWMVRIKK